MLLLGGEFWVYNITYQTRFLVVLFAQLRDNVLLLSCGWNGWLGYPKYRNQRVMSIPTLGDINPKFNPRSNIQYRNRLPSIKLSIWEKPSQIPPV